MKCPTCGRRPSERTWGYTEGDVYGPYGATESCSDPLHDLADSAPATVRRMREALESDLLMLAMSHTTHWDPKGTHGLNCPACKAASEWRDLKRAALSATARRGKEPNDG